MVYKIKRLTSHTTVILSLMFAVFLVLDLFNPLMNFVDNGISRALLALLCISGVSLSLSVWKSGRRKVK